MTLGRAPRDGEFWYVTSATARTGKVEPGLVQGQWIWLATWPKPIAREMMRFIRRVRIPLCPDDCLPDDMRQRK